jgi:hypothetical protein
MVLAAPNEDDVMHGKPAAPGRCDGASLPRRSTMHHVVSIQEDEQCRCQLLDTRWGVWLARTRSFVPRRGRRRLGRTADTNPYSGFNQSRCRKEVLVPPLFPVW